VVLGGRDLLQLTERVVILALEELHGRYYVLAHVVVLLKSFQNAAHVEPFVVFHVLFHGLEPAGRQRFLAQHIRCLPRDFPCDFLGLRRLFLGVGVFQI
jgi:hypothetical protein